LSGLLASASVVNQRVIAGAAANAIPFSVASFIRSSHTVLSA
jgi:hypothetical protein